MNYFKTKNAELKEQETPIYYKDLIFYEKLIFRAKWEYLLNKDSTIFMAAKIIIEIAEEEGKFDHIKFAKKGELKPVEGVKTCCPF